MNTNNNVSGVLLGVLIGGLAGAATMLLLAPQSGKDTRAVIQKKSIELRDRANEAVKSAVSQVSSSAKRVTAGGRRQFEDIKEKSKGVAVEGLDRMSGAIHASRNTVKDI